MLVSGSSPMVVVQSVVSDSLWPRELQPARLPCPSLSPGVCSNSSPLGLWHPQPSHPLLLPSPHALNLSQHQSFPLSWLFASNYWHFSFSISPSNEYSGLISFRIDWFDLPVVQGILKSLLQDHSSKMSVLQCSALFMESGTKTLP